MERSEVSRGCPRGEPGRLGSSRHTRLYPESWALSLGPFLLPDKRGCWGLRAPTSPSNREFFIILDMSPLSDTGFANIVSVAFLLILLTGSLLEQRSNLLFFFPL